MNDDIYSLYEKCELCPRRCGIDRTAGERGYCGAGTDARAALTMIHRWEEPCVSGSDAVKGSGAVFFAHCTLGCVYCQNYAISRRNAGENGSLKGLREMDAQSLAEEMLSLAGKGAYNINLVTPTHYMPVIVKAVETARNKGLAIPVVYNTGGFERPEMISLLEGTVDVFLTDMKYLSDLTAMKYSRTSGYVKNAREALDEMVRITGEGPEFDEEGMIRRGVIVRHLVLPGRARAAQEILKKLYARYSDRIIYSLMNQYTPLPEGNPELCNYPELLRPVSDGEYRRAVRTLKELSPEYAYIQEGGTISESFIPEW